MEPDAKRWASFAPRTIARPFAHSLSPPRSYIMLVGFYIFFTAVLMASAAPSPQPGNTLYKQTSRRDIVARLHSAPQRRTSAVPYPDCFFTSSQYDAAVYTGKVARFNIDDIIGPATVTSLQECIEACRSTAGMPSPV